MAYLLLEILGLGKNLDVEKPAFMAHVIICTILGTLLVYVSVSTTLVSLSEASIVCWQSVRTQERPVHALGPMES